MKNCILGCDNNYIEIFYKHQLTNLLICKNCGLIWQENFPNNSELIDFYKNKYYKINNNDLINRTHGNETRELNYKRSLFTFKSIKKKISKSKSLLDVGCGNNDLLIIAKKNNYDCKGLEISKEAAQKLINQGIDVFIGTIEEFSREVDRKYEIITLFHVLEHLYNPLHDLKRLKNFLKDDGTLIIEVPDIDSKKARSNIGSWWLFQPNEHLFYFNEVSLRNIFRHLELDIMLLEKREGLGLSRSKNNNDIHSHSKIKKVISIIIGKMFWLKIIVEKMVNCLGYHNVIRIYAKKRSLIRNY